MNSARAAHLPVCPIAPAAYGRLYSFNGRTDDFHDPISPAQEMRISPCLDEASTYRRLPFARDFEIGGYLTKTRIRFWKCDPARANMPKSKACTFHSHPTRLPLADVPSAMDVFQFLNFRHLRTVTVGSTRIWVWDKTAATMTIIRKLAAWVESHMLREIRRLEIEFPDDWENEYAKVVLKVLGLEWPTLDKWKTSWAELLRAKLRIKVRVFPMEAPGTMR